MKLDQKQMHIVSQLFMAAGKAGRAFDLGRFTKDAAYANDTMAQLATHADQVRNEPLQGLVISAMEMMASVTMQSQVANPLQIAPEPSAAPSLASAPLVEQKYVGKLR